MVYVDVISHQGRQKPGQETEKRPKKTTMEKSRDGTYTPLFTAPPECTARTASRTCSAVKRSHFLKRSSKKEVCCESSTYISQNLQQEAQSVLWGERVTSGHVCCRFSFVVFLRGFYFPVSTFLFTDYKLNMYTTSAIFVQNLIRFGWQFAGN